MKNPVQLFFVAAAAVFLTTACQNSKVYTVNVSGEGADFYPDSSLVLIYRDGADIRFDEPVAYAYLDKGAFSISFKDSSAVKYEMFFEPDFADNTFYTFPFISDRVPVKFHFTSKYGDICAAVTGSRDNEELYLYRNEWYRIYEPYNRLSYDVDKWISAHGGWPEEGSENEAVVIAMNERLNAVYDSITAVSDYERWRRDRMSTHLTLAGLTELQTLLSSQIQMFMQGGADSVDTFLLDLFDRYRKKYPGNGTVNSMDRLLASMERTRPGMPAPDFSAPALDGERYSLSELIEGRIAVLDCWASWCLPCRRHSIELIPVYEQYKDKGFTVIGVAGEFNSLDDMHKAIETDGYPWIQLYDLDRAEGIWELYGIDGGGGGIFLIDSDGRIVETVKDIASVKAYLQQHLD